MSPTWRPDDSFLDREGGKLKGVTRGKDALKKAGVKGGRRIITSQDPGMDEAIRSLPRGRMPKGFQSWQIPIPLGSDSEIGFITVGQPNAVVPEHAHPGEVFRMVTSGSIHFKGKVLTAGHWMYVPSGIPYGFTAGPLGCIVFHKYRKVDPPPKRRPPLKPKVSNR
ncbi:MAG TPA: hypothetical protein VGS16_01635 [Candidatus Dormibacteraeota bacterium]|nr:hypothetical protein [Candidatus Dormibacteraeota bacterium]